MIITIIAAMAENRVIGRDNELPWDLPSDLKRFKELTFGHSVIMGRKTFESIGHPLPGRRNIVITRGEHHLLAGCLVVPDLPAAITACAGEAEIFICGGEGVFREALAMAHKIYLTIIDEEFDGDTYFPAIPDDFVEIGRETVMDDALPYDFVQYERRAGERG